MFNWFLNTSLMCAYHTKLQKAIIDHKGTKVDFPHVLLAFCNSLSLYQKRFEIEINIISVNRNKQYITIILVTWFYESLRSVRLRINSNPFSLFWTLTEKIIMRSLNNFFHKPPRKMWLKVVEWYLKGRYWQIGPEGHKSHYMKISTIMVTFLQAKDWTHNIWSSQGTVRK